MAHLFTRGNAAHCAHCGNDTAFPFALVSLGYKVWACDQACARAFIKSLTTAHSH